MEGITTESVKETVHKRMRKRIITCITVILSLILLSAGAYVYLTEVEEVDFSKGFTSVMREIFGKKIVPDKNEELSLVLSEELERLNIKDVHFPKEVYDEKYIITGIEQSSDCYYFFNFRIRDTEITGSFSVFFADMTNGTSHIYGDVQQIEHLKVDGTDIVIYSMNDSFNADYIYDRVTYGIEYEIKDDEISFEQFREWMQVF